MATDIVTIEGTWLTSIGGDVSPVQVVRLEELMHGQRGGEVRGRGEA